MAGSLPNGDLASATQTSVPPGATKRTWTDAAFAAPWLGILLQFLQHFLQHQIFFLEFINHCGSRFFTSAYHTGRYARELLFGKGPSLPGPCSFQNRFLYSQAARSASWSCLFSFCKSFFPALTVAGPAARRFLSPCLLCPGERAHGPADRSQSSAKPAVNTRAVAIFSLVNNMVFSTPSSIPATVAETAPVVPAVPAANRLAA